MAEKVTSRPELVTLPEVARIFGLSPKTVRRAAALDLFPTYLVGNAWPRVLVDEFRDWVRSTRIESKRRPSPEERGRERAGETVRREGAIAG